MNWSSSSIDEIKINRPDGPGYETIHLIRDFFLLVDLNWNQMEMNDDNAMHDTNGCAFPAP